MVLLLLGRELAGLACAQGQNAGGYMMTVPLTNINGKIVSRGPATVARWKLESIGVLKERVLVYSMKK